ncbi:glyoxalase [Burkholderia cepacia]|uniref:glyoxalase n=1 Tax=Burkholderia cepacia TaxID=292 RepID=UPI002AB60723|nr:glyoxalase [Burkholderia cepacia]
MTHKFAPCRIFGKPRFASLTALLLTTTSVALAQSLPISNVGDQVILPGAQYTATHIYTSVDKINDLVASLQAALGGGQATPVGPLQITPAPSNTKAYILTTPAGGFSIFAFYTPIPYGFGDEHVGYYVTDINAAVRKAVSNGANVVVSYFSDPVGTDAIVQWPGGIKSQFYHTNQPRSEPPLRSVPEQRVYLSGNDADKYIIGYLRFTGGRVIKDIRNANGIDIGEPNKTYRLVKLQSTIGKVTILVTDGHMPYPYGIEHDGFEVPGLAAALQNAMNLGATPLTKPIYANGRTGVIVSFPGGFIAELHEKDSP